MPEGRTWGQKLPIEFGREGTVWWLRDAEENTCGGPARSAILEFDHSELINKLWRGGMFVVPKASWWIGKGRLGN